jgi:hypothetical protein
LGRLKQTRNPASKLKKPSICPHCGHEWRKHKNSKKCPHCARSLDPTAKVNVSPEVKRHKIPDLINEKRFTPSVMKLLVDARLYRYLGIPTNMVKLTAGRENQRMANLKLADRFLNSDLQQGEFGTAMELDRAAIFFRLSKGFKTLAEYGRFVLTERGRQKIAEQKLRAEIGAEGELSKV